MPRSCDGGYFAEGRGQCGQCLRPIEVGEKFWWKSGTPAETQCQKCRERRRRRKR
jgi:hypothetical protein